MTIRFGFLAVLGLSLGLALSACGRKGDLDTPGTPLSNTSPAADPALATGTPEPLPGQPPESDKPFFLDFLIR